MSKRFQQKSITPDFVFSSPANRALTTCRIFTEVLNLKENTFKIEEELYDFGGESVINFIKTIDKKNEVIMIFGHNHAFTSICNIFGNNFIDNLPTSGLVVIDFDIDSWENIKKGVTRFSIFPRDLK